MSVQRFVFHLLFGKAFGSNLLGTHTVAACRSASTQRIVPSEAVTQHVC